jgi:hypothetical protein
MQEVMGTRDPVFAEWFTGVLIVPDGKMLQYVHMPYASRFERELRVVVVLGLILSD